MVGAGRIPARGSSATDGAPHIGQIVHPGEGTRTGAWGVRPIGSDRDVHRSPDAPGRGAGHTHLVDDHAGTVPTHRRVAELIELGRDREAAELAGTTRTTAAPHRR